MAEELKTGHEMMDEAIKEPTPDKLLDRNPHNKGNPWTREDTVKLVKQFRREREMFIDAQAKHGEPKEDDSSD
jgi:hypothetical protein